MANSQVDRIFFEMINGEDWNIPEVDDAALVRDLPPLLGDIPMGSYILPTPLPGIFFTINMGFEIENPEEDENNARG